MDDVAKLLALSPDQFVHLLTVHGIHAFHIVFVDGKITASHPLLQPIADYILSSPDFDAHEGLFYQVGPSSKTLQSAVIHRTCRGSGSGGIRNWFYDTVEHMILDGLRLSKGMTHKNALAGLWWGGGKGVMARNSGTGLLPAVGIEASRKVVYEEYGEFISKLRGCYVTAEDVGTSPQDMEHIFTKTRYTTCIPPSLGGSGNPSVATARGVARAMEAAFDHLGVPIKGSSIAVQGVGHVGTPLIHLLFSLGVSRIHASDVDAHRASSIKSEFAQYGSQFSLTITDKSDLRILYEDVDAIAPCATGGILNPTTIPNIKAKIICGAANNQLLDIMNDDKLLQSRNILYIPDFLANRMGIVNCADEHAGTMIDDPKIELHLGTKWENSVYNLSRQILRDAESMGKTTQEISVSLADERSRVLNHIYGHRGIDIIKSLVEKDPVWRDLCKDRRQIN